ncbi:MAG: hypothetical protein J0H00_14770 [Burkholderiales bacterium]|nr:hypothetical protein [Burkholderiales bacterium]
MAEITSGSPAEPMRPRGGETVLAETAGAPDRSAGDAVGGVSRAEIAERTRTMRWMPLAIPLMAVSMLACMALVLSET